MTDRTRFSAEIRRPRPGWQRSGNGWYRLGEMLAATEGGLWQLGLSDDADPGARTWGQVQWPCTLEESQIAVEDAAIRIVEEYVRALGGEVRWP